MKLISALLIYYTTMIVVQIYDLSPLKDIIQYKEHHNSPYRYPYILSLAEEFLEVVLWKEDHKGHHRIMFHS